VDNFYWLQVTMVIACAVPIKISELHHIVRDSVHHYGENFVYLSFEKESDDAYSKLNNCGEGGRRKFHWTNVSM